MTLPRSEFSSDFFLFCTLQIEYAGPHQGMIHHFYCMGGAIPYARTAIRAAGMAGALAEVDSVRATYDADLKRDWVKSEEMVTAFTVRTSLFK
jgi:hypothetical protein